MKDKIGSSDFIHPHIIPIDDLNVKTSSMINNIIPDSEPPHINNNNNNNNLSKLTTNLNSHAQTQDNNNSITNSIILTKNGNVNNHQTTSNTNSCSSNSSKESSSATSSASSLLSSSNSINTTTIINKIEHVLNEKELKAVDEFLQSQNWPNSDARKWNTAVKFLMARKFDVPRAIKLFNEHESLRKRESLDCINLNDEDFLQDLQSGKFTILPFVKNYPVCALFTVKLHSNKSTPSSELITLKTLIYQLDAALENPEAQRNGINFIYDMNNCKRSNYDLSLSQKILTLVRGSYPARLNKLFVVAAPFWFKCIVKVLSILVRDKIRERVLFVSTDELKNQIPIEVLPDYLGGVVKLNHSSWLIECNKLVTNKASTCSGYYYFNSQNTINGNIVNDQQGCESKKEDMSKISSSSSATATVNSRQICVINTNGKRNSSDFIDTEEKKQAKKPAQSNNHSPLVDSQNIIEKINPLPFKTNHYESIQNFEIVNDHLSGFSVNDLFEHVQKIHPYDLTDEFNSIKFQQITSSIEVFRDRENTYRNRYKDVVCLDDSRVKLEYEQSPNADGLVLNGEHRNDYIHANYVDGYKQKNAYISTQGPLDETVEDFWLMIWQQMTLVIAMTTKVIEQRKLKCSQYWPAEVGQTFNIDLFDITNLEVEDLGDYKTTKLSIKHLATGETRIIVHCQFLSWPDHGVPKTAQHIIEFIELVRGKQVECLAELNKNHKWLGHPMGPPICVHCSAGIGRTGTFCTIDISLNRLKDNIHNINIIDTVKKIRLQRAQSVQTRDQYVFCYLAVLEYAKREGLYTGDNNIDLDQVFDNIFERN